MRHWCSPYLYAAAGCAGQFAAARAATLDRAPQLVQHVVQRHGSASVTAGRPLKQNDATRALRRSVGCWFTMLLEARQASELSMVTARGGCRTYAWRSAEQSCTAMMGSPSVLLAKMLWQGT